MKKRELLHVHALLMTVADECVERGDLDPGALAAYHDLGVTPMSLQAPREDHEAAVLALADAIEVDIDAATADDAQLVAAE